jgi:hypothetical protein
MRPRSRASLSLDNYSTPLRAVGPTLWLGHPRFLHPWYVRNVLCPDGKRRTAYLGPDAETFFSWPCRVKYNNTWHKGFVTTPNDADTVFTPNSEDN